MHTSNIRYPAHAKHAYAPICHIFQSSALFFSPRLNDTEYNKNWADTTRNSLLFLFFGYFGGRNSFSRTFLLLSSPLCFVIQTRPVKVAMKQLFYSIGQPPGILLSLLPAPQQAIMSCDYSGSMRGLYGEKALEGEDWLEMERSEEEEMTRNKRRGGNIDGKVADLNDEYDDYDEVDEVDNDDDDDE